MVEPGNPMNDENDEIDVEELFHIALSQVLSQVTDKGILLSRWLIVFESISEDGKAVSLVRSPNTENWEALGMAAAATELLKGTIGFLHMEDDEDDD